MNIDGLTSAPDIRVGGVGADSTQQGGHDAHVLPGSVPEQSMASLVDSDDQIQVAMPRALSIDKTTESVRSQVVFGKIKDPDTFNASRSTALICKVPKGVRFKGDATFPCDVEIEGDCEGSISTLNGKSISVEISGTVVGELTSENIKVRGLVNGNINASNGLVHFASTAVCTGQVLYSRLSIEEGAELEASTKKVAASHQTN